MPTLYVRNVPDDIYILLREAARKDHRSLNAEVIYLLECALSENTVPVNQSDILKRIQERRGAYRFPDDAQDSTESLRADRDR
ncbi:MAG: Arc family DNA-binding protein [bacterium]|nr:Arc family DNA-binding protein [bacterium]